MNGEPIPIRDSGFNTVAWIVRRGDAIEITFDQDTTYMPGDSLVLGIKLLKKLVKEKSTHDRTR